MRLNTIMASLVLFSALSATFMGLARKRFLATMARDLTACRWNWTADQVIQRANEICAAVKMAEKEIEDLHPAEVTFAKLAKLGFLSNDVSADAYVITSLSQLSPNAEVRAASVEAEKLISEQAVQSRMNVGVFRAISALESNASLMASLSGEEERLVKLSLRDFIVDGLNEPKEVRKQIQDLRKQLSDLSTEFAQNLSEDKSTVEFTEEELEGTPKDTLSSMEKKDGKFIVTMKYPHVLPVLDHCVVEKTREDLQRAFLNRASGANLPLLAQALTLRHECALLLKKSCHSEWKLQQTMAKDPAKVRVFLEDLASRLKTVAVQELEELAEMKKRDSDAPLASHDIRFYKRKRELEKFAVDQEHLRQYFDLERVISKNLELFGSILGLQYSKVENPHVWADDVTMMKVSDADSGDVVGYFYLDLYPREGKYGHAAVFPLAPGCLLSTGERQLPVAAMVANFPKPSKSSPSLMSHDQVVTFAHEFGHLMHFLCSGKKPVFSEHSGFGVETDFVETPSQIMENWMWEPSVLMDIGQHHETGETLTEEEVVAVAKSRCAHPGLDTARQVSFAMFDLSIHTTPPEDAGEVFKEISERYYGVPVPKDTHFEASFGHIMGGYDSKYYGYLWSEVFSMDCFERFKKEGLVNSDLGREWREKVLAQGALRDSDLLLQDFLGREPNADAFLKSKGVELP